MGKLSDKELLAALTERLAAKNDSIREVEDLNSKLQGAYEKLLEAEKVKTQFLSDIRNEINNPLSAIMGLSKMIVDNKDLSVDQIRNFAENIQFDSFNLNFQMMNIVASADFESGEIDRELLNTSPVKLVENVIGEFDFLIRRTKQKLTFSFDGIEEEDKFKLDPDKVKLVLRNLILNAVKYSDEGKEIKVHLTIGLGNLVLSVQDYGIGIKEEYFENIFNRFVKISVAKHGLTGHGLGMSLIKSIMDMYSFQMDIDSTIGQGSTFTLTMPIVKGEESEGTEFDGDDDFECF